MPYGLPKELEGEENEVWMNSCIASVVIRGKNINPDEAMVLCRRKLVEKSGDRGRANIAVINELLELYSEDRKNK